MKSRATKKAASLVSALTLCVSLLCSGMAFRAAAAGEKVLTPDSTWVLDAYSPTKTPTLEGQKITNTSPISASMGTAAAPAANSSVIRIPDVDFGADGYAEAVLSLGVPSYTSGTTGRIAMMLGEVYNEVVALFSVSGDAAADHTASFTRKITGVHDVVLVMETAAGDLNSLTLQGAPAADLPAHIRLPEKPALSGRGLGGALRSQPSERRRPVRLSGRLQKHLL